jgi:hypothetical protein
MSIRGSVDSVGSREIIGWAYSADHPDGVAVQAVINNEIIGDTLANLYRPDLAGVGLGDGNCGYVINLFRQIDPLYLPFIAVKVHGGDIELPRSSPLGFAEFFSSFYRMHPSAGRSRSVFGGLWTDRIDAAAMLRGKVAVGQIGGDAAAAIAPLVHSGISVFANGAKASARRRTPEFAGAVVDDALTLEVLHGVLEDNPVVLGISDLANGLSTGWSQPSAQNASPSPAECVTLVALLGNGNTEVTIEVVRDSHKLPEFTRLGVSRWANEGTHAGLELVLENQGMVDAYTLRAGSVALIGAGTIYRVPQGENAAGLRLVCAPSRALPVKLELDEKSDEVVSGRGIRVLAGD